MISPSFINGIPLTFLQTDDKLTLYRYLLVQLKGGIYLMSKKEQKLKKNLYKALTEYFIHNVKNSLSSSENILDQLASFRMETRLPAALRQDKKYQKAQKNCNKANEKMQDLNLTPQQWDAVDATITAENIASIEYIRIAYKQGIIDAFSILRETL